MPRQTEIDRMLKVLDAEMADLKKRRDGLLDMRKATAQPKRKTKTEKREPTSVTLPAASFGE